MQFSAKTKNEAITKACIELGVSSDQLDIQVVSEGSSGFFGIGSKPAIIKARKVDDNSEEKEIEKIHRRGREMTWILPIAGGEDESSKIHSAVRKDCVLWKC